MKLVETTVSEKYVHVRLANDADRMKAMEWIDVQMPLSHLKHPSDERQPLGDPELQFFAEVRLAALRYARGLIAEETTRLGSLHGRTRL